MNEQYQKIAYIGLRNKKGEYTANVPLYVKLDEIDSKDMQTSREEVISKVTQNNDATLRKTTGGNNVGQTAYNENRIKHVRRFPK